MSEQPQTITGAFPRATAVARWGAAVLGAGGLAALFWLFLMQEGFGGQILHRTWTEHDFAGGLGHTVATREVARAGLYLTLLLGVAATLVFVAIERILPWRGWRKGIAYSPVLFLAWGAVYCPLVDARRVLRGDDFAYLPSGAFGMDGGHWTFVSAVVASLVAGCIIARVLPMVRDAAWWERHPDATRRADHEELFELAEERAEQGMERAG